MMFWDRIKDRLSLLKSLNLAKHEARPALLWQAPKGRSRIVTKVMVIEVDESVHEIILMPAEGKFHLEFNDRELFYLRFPHRSLLLKARGRLGQDSLILDFPTEILVQEYRASPRLSYGSDTAYKALIRKLDQGIISQDKFQLPLFDISSGGFSVLVSTQESNLFFLEDTILVYQLGSLKFNDPLRAKLLYMIKLPAYSSGQSRSYKLGLAFERQIAMELLQTLPYSEW